MSPNFVSRRDLLGHALLGSAGATLSGGFSWNLVAANQEVPEPTGSANLSIATFGFDVTPPIGHPCCGGWIKPVEVIDDALEAKGIVLLGAGKPIVLCAVDWTGILNEAHVAWRVALAEAAGTTPDRVAIHCVHQHNAPFACTDAEGIIAEQVAAGRKLSPILDLDYFKRCLDKGQAAVNKALRQTVSVSHIGWGSAKVDRVASNRRVSRDNSGKVLAMRGSACKDAKLCALPEGLIDPMLRTIAFFDREKKVASCHFYAVHPMSFYADGRVTSDFAGLARKARQAQEPDCHHIYFTGCAGNIAAGKYNDGSKQARIDLTKRLHEALVASEAKLEKTDPRGIVWNTASMIPTGRATPTPKTLAMLIGDKDKASQNPNRLALELAFHRRCQKKIPIVLGSLRVGPVRTLHLPAESFVEYQLDAHAFAQSKRADAFVATAAYGDGGPWYIPTPEEFPNGGYEVSVAFADSSFAKAMKLGIESLL